jgi:PAS domain S-box-containing protein
MPNSKPQNKVGSIRVLHVDDDASILEVSKQILQDMDPSLDVDFASSADEAFDKLASAKYDVVVSDYEMPIKNGLDFLKELKERGVGLPFILFTGKGREEVAITALNLGADGYFNKQGSPETVYGELMHGLKAAIARKKAELALLESQDRFQKAQAIAHVGNWEIDLKTQKMWASDEAFKIYGLERTSDNSLPLAFVQKMVFPEHRPKMDYALQELILKNKDYNVEFKIRRADNGEERFIHSKAELLRDQDRTPIKVSGVIQDITEGKRSEERLSSLNRALRTISKSNQALLHATNGIAFAKEVCNIIVRDCGYELAWVGFTNGKDKKVRPIAYAGFDKEYIDFAEITWEDSNRGQGPTGTAIRTGRPTVCRNIPTDPTFEPWREEAIERGYTSSIALPLTSQNKTFGALNIYSQEPDPFSDEEVNLLVELASDFAYGVKSLQTRTDKERAEEALRLSEEKYRSLVENAIDIICTHDLKGQITSINRAVEKYGLKKDEVIGRNTRELIPAEYWPAIAAQGEELTQGNSIQGEAEVITPVGKIDIEYKSNPIWQGKKIVGGQTIMRDISERKKTEQLLKTDEERLRAIISNAPIGIATSDFNLYHLTANNAYCRILGYSEDELKKLTFKEITHPEDLRATGLKIAKLSAGEISFFTLEKRYIRKDGTIIDGKVTVNAIRDKSGKPTLFVHELEDITESKKAKVELEQRYEILERVTESLESGLAIINKDYDVIWANTVIKNLGVAPNKKCYQTFNNLNNVCPDCGVRKIFEQNAPFDVHEYKTADQKGETVWIELRATPLKDKKGKTIAALELAIPITEQKKAEDQLAAVNEKLRVIGKLTRHDVRNKLSVISANTYLLRKKLADNPEVADQLNAIESASRLADRLLEFGKFYERIGVEEQKKINVRQCFNEAVALTENLGAVKVVNKCKGFTAMADSLLRQVFYNLIDNSLKHGKKVTKIKLSCNAEDGATTLVYEDDGVGVPEANKTKLFTEGFTTSEGTGLGLAMIQKILQVYGWTITEEGEPGKGAKFVITISHQL